MGGLPNQLKWWIWWRDYCRCRGCGGAVAQENGCLPQTHHVTPKSRGGTDEPNNLTTLCLLCHGTLDSLNHMRILDNIRAGERPSCIKALLWAYALEAALYAENLSWQKFPAQQVLDYLEKLQHAIEYIRDETLDAIQENPNLLLNKAEFRYEDPDRLEAFLQGIRTFYWSRQAREVFNEEVRDDSPWLPKSWRAVFLWTFARLRDMTKQS
jgi:hypothetical protein